MNQPPSLAIAAPNGEQEIIIFTQASGAQLEQCLKLYATAFGRPLSTADRMESEEHFRQRPLNRDNATRTWCLALENNPSKVVCMCKTVPREFLVREVKGTSVKKGYCIASVVTDQAYRGRGLASFMLKELAVWLDGPGDAIASMLYSSVGAVGIPKLIFLSLMLIRASVLRRQGLGLVTVDASQFPDRVLGGICKTYSASNSPFDKG